MAQPPLCDLLWRSLSVLVSSLLCPLSFAHVSSSISLSPVSPLCILFSLLCSFVSCSASLASSPPRAFRAFCFLEKSSRCSMLHLLWWTCSQRSSPIGGHVRNVQGWFFMCLGFRRCVSQHVTHTAHVSSCMFPFSCVLVSSAFLLDACEIGSATLCCPALPGPTLPNHALILL